MGANREHPYAATSGRDRRQCGVADRRWGVSPPGPARSHYSDHRLYDQPTRLPIQDKVERRVPTQVHDGIDAGCREVIQRSLPTRPNVLPSPCAHSVPQRAVYVSGGGLDLHSVAVADFAPRAAHRRTQRRGVRRTRAGWDATRRTACGRHDLNLHEYRMSVQDADPELRGTRWQRRNPGSRTSGAGTRSRGRVDVLRDDGRRVVGQEGRPAGDKLVEHRAERVGVGARGDLATVRLLGGHVSDSAHHQPVLREPRAPHVHRESKVADLGNALRSESEPNRASVPTMTSVRSATASSAQDLLGRLEEESRV